MKPVSTSHGKASNRRTGFSDPDEDSFVKSTSNMVDLPNARWDAIYRIVLQGLQKEPLSAQRDEPDSNESLSG